MRHTALPALCLILSAAALAGPPPSDFRFVADIQGDATPNLPVRVPLSRDILAAGRPDLADVRLFDNLGRETPYVVYQQTEALQAPGSFTFAIVSYDDADGVDRITLKRPDGAPPSREIELLIAGNDFRKQVEIAAGSAPDAATVIAASTIFDFSSRLALRKTTVPVPETDAPFLQIRLSDAAPPSENRPEMRLHYEGLEFWTAGVRPGPFRVERIVGRFGGWKPEERHFDSITITAPTAVLDNDGNSVVHIDGRLPVAYVGFDVENPYYHRRVQLLTAGDDQDAAYRVAATGVIYRFPGMAESLDRITCDQPSRHVRLRVLNEDNPPLKIRSIEIGWVRRNLYFVPEPARTYALYVGSSAVAAPRYELADLLPADHAHLKHYASMTVLGIRSNANYAPRLPTTTREATEKSLLVGVVVALVAAMSVWAYRLLKRMPATTARTANPERGDDHGMDGSS